jgi:hypothetical protein
MNFKAGNITSDFFVTDKNVKTFFDFLTFILSLEKCKYMKNVLMMISTVAFLVACDGSEKGAWSDEDKQKVIDEVKNVESTLDFILGNKKEAYVNCYLEKLENNYEDFDAAYEDKEGSEKYAVDCMQDVLIGN